MAEPQRRRTRNVADKRARIVAAAQVLFTQMGYSQTSVRDIAERAGVAAGLVIKHFESKLRLFEVALVEAFTSAPVTSEDRPEFGRRLANVLLSKETKVVSPVMIMLSLEDEEARRVAMKVVRDYAIKPTAEWLGGPQASERAVYVTLLGLSLVLLDRLFDGDQKPEVGSPPVDWIVESIQRAVS